MSSIPSFTFGWFMDTTVGGQNDYLGSRTTGKTFAASGSGGKWWEVPTQTLGAGQIVDLYNYTNDGLPNIAAFIAEILAPTDGTAKLQIDLLVDSPTSASNTAASGAAPLWNAVPSLAYGMPWCIGMNEALTNPSAALHAAGPLGAAGEVLGRIYRIRAKNPTAYPVTVARYVRN